MRTIVAALVGATVVASSIGCAKGTTRGPAWTRWGITQPTTEPDAEAKLADAYRWFYALRGDSARAAYDDLVRRYPQSADAHLGLSLTYRYSGMPDSALVEARAAYKLDSAAAGVLVNYADLLLPIRTGPLPDMTDSARYAESDRLNLKAAASRHPIGAHAHISLWSSYMARGRLSDARRQARELSRKRYYPQPLLDFARNLLVGLEPNAILFTNGDNDTYPLWALQQAERPFRPDVTVANLTLLNIRPVVKMMRDSLGLPVSFTDEEIDSLAPKAETVGQSISPPMPAGQQVVANVIANAAKAGRPVYFAVTVGGDQVTPYPFAARLVLEGLIHRVAEGKRTAPVDFDRLAENLKKYRLKWPKTFPPWPANMSPTTRVVAPLAQNYGILCAQLAYYYASQGRKAEAADASSNAVAWTVRSGDTGGAHALVDAWLARAPDDAKAKEWKARLEKADTVH